MAIELEAKIRVDRFEPIIERLLRHGAEDQGLARLRDLFFDRPDRSLRQEDAGLRIREMIHEHHSEILMCYKGRKLGGPFKQREELEFGVDHLENAVAFLEALGFEQTLRVDKTRHLWQFQLCEVCLDELGPVGRFVEIEGPDEAAIASVREHLGLKEGELIFDSYASMTQAWQESQNGRSEGDSDAETP